LQSKLYVFLYWDYIGGGSAWQDLIDGNIGPEGPEKQMVMVGHQHIGKKLNIQPPRFEARSSGVF
jgi:hypothetical protein